MLRLAPTSTPRPVAGDTAEEIARISGCDNCHLIGDMGEAGKVGPDLSSIGVLASQRVPGESASEYLRASIVDPEAYIAPDCPNGPCLEGIMPGDYEPLDGRADRHAGRLSAGTEGALCPQLARLATDQAPSDGISPVRGGNCY